MTSDERLIAAIDEFATDYVGEDEGRHHLAVYMSQREEGRANFRNVLTRAEGGEDVTELVLTKLLPHLGSPHNRERGAWIHVAPAITRDMKRWFERAGWASPEDWPRIAESVL